jgi:hypothetical protein
MFKHTLFAIVACAMVLGSFSATYAVMAYDLGDRVQVRVA